MREGVRPHRNLRSVFPRDWSMECVQMAMAADSLEGVPLRNCTDLRTCLIQEQNERARRRVLRILFCICERNFIKP